MALERDIEIRIKTEAELKAAREAEAVLKETGAAAKGAGRDAGSLGGELDDLAGKFPGVGRAAEIAMNPIALSLAAITAGVLGLKKGIENFSFEQIATTGLDQSLAQQGKLTEAYREELQRFSNEVEAATGVANERILGLMSTLTQAGAGSENIHQLTQAVIDLAGALPGLDKRENLEQASTIFIQAMNGRTQSLERLGISVDKTKSRTEQLEDIMRQLNQRGGEQLEARTKTIKGKFELLAMSAGNFWEGLGNVISRSQILQAVLGALTGALNLLNSIWPATAERVEGVTNKMGPLASEAGRAAAAMEGLESAGQSAKAGLEKALEAAGRTVEMFRKAADAVDKLRQRQDQLAEAETAEELASFELSQVGVPDTAANRARADLARAGIRQRGAAKRQAIAEAAVADQERALEAARRQSSELFQAAAQERDTAQAALEQAREANKPLLEAAVRRATEGRVTPQGFVIEEGIKPALATPALRPKPAIGALTSVGTELAKRLDQEEKKLREIEKLKAESPVSEARADIERNRNIEVRLEKQKQEVERLREQKQAVEAVRDAVDKLNQAEARFREEKDRELKAQAGFEERQGEIEFQRRIVETRGRTLSVEQRVEQEKLKGGLKAEEQAERKAQDDRGDGKGAGQRGQAGASSAQPDTEADAARLAGQFQASGNRVLSQIDRFASVVLASQESQAALLGRFSQQIEMLRAQVAALQRR